MSWQRSPARMKMGNDLEPQAKRVVRQYLKDTQGFDPYEMEAQTEEADIPILSDEEMTG